MRTSFAITLTGALALSLAISTGAVGFAQEKVAPVRLDRDKMAGLNLTAIPPDPYRTSLSPAI